MNFDSSFLSPEKMDNWELYSAALNIEMRQCRDEGKDVAQYEKLAEVIAEMERTPVREELAKRGIDLRDPERTKTVVDN